MNVTRPQPRRSGFSLFETMMVVIIVGIVSAVARPALRLLEESRQLGAAQEVERMLVLARTHALATGRPTGLHLSEDGLRMVMIEGAGLTPDDVIGADGMPRGVHTTGESQRLAWITSIASGSGATVSEFTAWFGIDGTPELRDSNGVRTGAWTSDLLVVVAGGHEVRVRRMTGTVERQ